MIIELYGLPGAGKTTLARELSGQGMVYGGFSQKKYALKFVIRYPLIALLWVWFVLYESLLSGKWSLLRYKLALLGATATNYIKAKASPESQVVLDEGFVQRLLSISETMKTKKFLSFMMRNAIPRIDVIYVVCLDDNLGMSKRYTHPDHPRSRLGDAYLKQWQAALVYNNKIIEEIIISSNISHTIYKRYEV